MRIALFGGSFNPIHNAHIKLAKRFLTEVDLDCIYFVPTFKTPLKDNSCTVSAEHRLEMCKLALRDFDQFRLSDVEIVREGTSYSCDTIAYFIKEFPSAQLFFIMGADMFFTLEKWNNFEYIFQNVTILTAPRDEENYTSLCLKLSDYKKYDCKAYITKEYIEDLSSTMIRDMIRENIDVSEYLNKDVIEYIKQNDLYR